MRIGLINQLHGRPGPDQPTWRSILARAGAAEAAGFDVFVFEDALLYPSDEGNAGCWESMTIAAGLAAATGQIAIGQSVVNSPYRAPGLVAKMAETIDEISGGRYVLGIGAGNSPDGDYRAFGFPLDHRYSRFAESITIIHSLLKTGRATYSGEFVHVDDAELVLRGPRPNGPPINIAAGGPKMLRLAARYGDEWNWWSWNETPEQRSTRLRPIVDGLDAACEAEDRDAASLVRTLDLYSVVSPGFDADGSGMEQPVHGGPEEIAATLLGLREFGFDAVRCDVHPKTPEAIEAMEPVVRLVHDG